MSSRSSGEELGSEEFGSEEYAALPEVLTAVEVARILDTSEQQVCRWAAAGTIPGVRIGRLWRFSKTRIEALINPPQ